MRSRIFVGVLAVVGLFSAIGFASKGSTAGPDRRWAIVNITSPVQLGDQFLMGKYLIVHDDAKMARGEACTSIYRFDAARGPQEEVVSFHCIPSQREICEETTLKMESRTGEIAKIVEYQFAGDTEGHGVPAK